MVSAPTDKPSDRPSDNSSESSSEKPEQPQKPRGKHLPINLTALAINHFRDLYFREGKINAFQVCEISDALREKGPQEAMEKLRQFLREIDQQQNKQGKTDK